MATLAREPLVMPAPRPRQIGAVDFVPNLLVTTLAVVATTLPPGEQWTDSAPSVKQTYTQQVTRSPLTLGINPNPEIQKRWSESAPPSKAAVYAQQQSNTLALGINPPPQVKQVSASAPSLRRLGAPDSYPNLSVTTLAVTAFDPAVTIDLGGYQARPWIGFDSYPNLLETTLSTAPVQPIGQQLSASAPFIRAQLRVDPYPNMLVLGINPNPRANQLDPSAPWIKYQPKVDVYPNLSLTTLAPITFPAGQQLSTSAPFPKFAVKVDTYPNTLVLGINPQPKVLQLSASAPPPKYAVQVDRYPNLTTSTLYVPPVFPVGKQWSDSATTNTAKYQLRVDVPTNYSGSIPASLLLPKLYRQYRGYDAPVPNSRKKPRRGR